MSRPDSAANGHNVDALWAEFRETRDATLRNRLVLQYSPLVKYVAGRVRSRLPDTVEVDDLVSDGVVGLIDAISRFEPARGLSFQTFAVPRIRGAILDGLRSMDMLPRSVRARAREVQAARVALEQELGRTPTEEEIAAKAGLTVATLRDLRDKASIGNQSTLDGYDLADELAGTPGSAVEEQTVSETLLEVVGELPERDQIIIALYYFEGFTLAEIGRVLGVSEARVSQVHSRATKMLRAKLDALEP